MFVKVPTRTNIFKTSARTSELEPRGRSVGPRAVGPVGAEAARGAARGGAAARRRTVAALRSFQYADHTAPECSQNLPAVQIYTIGQSTRFGAAPNLPC